MEWNYFKEGDLADLLQEMEETQKKEASGKEEIESSEMKASKRRYQEIMRKHERS